MRALATTLALLTAAIPVGSLALYIVANATEADLQPLGFNGVASLVLTVTLPGIGWLIATRRPENRIGWMLLAIGFFYALTQLSEAWAVYGLVAAPGALPLADVMSWLTRLIWAPAYMLLILLPLVFPDGRLPSRRWRPIVWIASAALALIVVPEAIALWPYRGPLLVLSTAQIPTS